MLIIANWPLNGTEWQIIQKWMKTERKQLPSPLNSTCSVFTPVSYLRRTPECWAPSSCGSCLSSRWKIWGGLSSVWEGWTLGSGTLQGRKYMYHTLWTVRAQIRVWGRSWWQVVLSQRRRSLCLLYDDGLGRRGKFGGLPAATPRGMTTERRGQEPWKSEG